MNFPFAVARLGDVAHAGMGEELGPVAYRIRKIGDGDGILGADVAAAAAVAAAGAAGLLDADDIGRGLEADSDGRAHDVMAEGGSRGFERAEFREALGAGVALRVEP